MIPPAELLVAFVAAGLLLNITPGPDMAFVAAQSAARGKCAGLAAALGISTGSMGHTILVAFGLAAILETSQLAFTVIKLVGAAYLLYLAYMMTIGAQASRGAGDPQTEEAPHSNALLPKRPAWRAYRQAIMVNLLNPKVALFQIAFLPQFIAPAQGHAAAQMLVLGAIFAIVAVPVNGVVAVTASSIARHAKGNARMAAVGRWLLGGFFAGLAVRLALVSQR